MGWQRWSRQSCFEWNLLISIRGRSEFFYTQDAFVEVKGINPIDFGLPNQAALVRPLPARLEGARKNFDGTIIPGGQTIVEFGELNYIPNIFGNTKIKMRANLCYLYTTSVSSKICIKRNILEIRDQPEICKINEDKPADHIAFTREIDGKNHVIYDGEDLGEGFSPAIDRDNLAFIKEINGEYHVIFNGEDVGVGEGPALYSAN